MRRTSILLLATALFTASCAAEPVTPVDEVAEAPTFVASPPTATPAPEPSQVEGDDAELDATPFAMKPTPTAATSPPKSTPVPTITQVTATAVVPQPTATSAAPRPTATTRPVTPTPPLPTATAVPPAPTATAAPEPWPEIGCSISPTRPVAVGEHLTFEAISYGSNLAVNFAFDHGDGTLDPRQVSTAYYEAPGTYTVKLRWSHAYAEGVEWCGQVQVEEQLIVDPEPECLVGPGPADGLGWYCNGQWCAPNDARSICPKGPIYGCLPHVNGGTICIDPAPAPDVTCSISPSGQVAVGQALQFSAQHFPPTVPITFAFDHGDGTIDPGAVSNAYYAEPGTYTVKLRWSTDIYSDVEICGQVVVVS